MHALAEGQATFFGMITAFPVDFRTPAVLLMERGVYNFMRGDITWSNTRLTGKQLNLVCRYRYFHDNGCCSSCEITVDVDRLNNDEAYALPLIRSRGQHIIADESCFSKIRAQRITPKAVILWRDTHVMTVAYARMLGPAPP